MRGVLSLALFALACTPVGGGGSGDGGGVESDAAMEGDGTVQGDGAIEGDGAMDGEVADAAVPENVILYPHVVNLVDPEAAEAARAFIRQEGDLKVPARAIYEHFADDYDFLYIFADAFIENAPIAIFNHVRQEEIPSIGRQGAIEDLDYGSPAQLKGIIGMNPTPVGNGPTLHETAHYWGQFLDDQFGFGRDVENNFGPHWGLAGVKGQLGGFDPETLVCVNGEALPDCGAEEGTRYQVQVARFGPIANGGDSSPYAPIELYLMGLIPAEEVPPILVLDEGRFMPESDFVFEISGMHEVTIEDIVAVHGERPPLEQRDYRAGFVLVSDVPASEELMQTVNTWARRFGGL